MTQEATIKAALRALLAAGGAVLALEELHGTANAQLGPGNTVTLEIEMHIQVRRDPGRSIDDALAAWADLAGRARGHLPEYDPTMMMIRSHHVRRIARRGTPGDLDQVVSRRAGEVTGRATNQVAEYWVGIARADLAVALLERARFGALDPTLTGPDPDGDLAGAAELIDGELARRVERHGPDHPFTWRAQGVRGSVLVAQAARAGEPTRGMLGEQALVVADRMVQHEWYRRNAHTAQALRGQLLRAEALSTLDRLRDAESEARLAAVLSRRYRGMDPGQATMVLARIQAGTDLPAALATATEALAARRQWYPERNYRVTEAELLVAELQERISTG